MVILGRKKQQLHPEDIAKRREMILDLFPTMAGGSPGCWGAPGKKFGTCWDKLSVQTWV